MMDQRRLTLSCSQGHLQGLADLFGLQACVHVIAHDLARIRIRYQAQIDEFSGGREIRDIGYPHLLRLRGEHLSRPLLEQVGVASEAVMAIRGLMIGSLWLYQQPLLAQDVKESIASQFDFCTGKGCTEHAVQLARADAWLAQAYRLHQLDDSLRPVQAMSLALTALVIRLAADADTAAGPFDA